MATYTIQLNTSYPVPRYRTFEPTFDPVPLVAPREVVKADTVGAEHGDQHNRDKFETYLHQHEALAAGHNTEGPTFDPANDIEAKSAYLPSPASEDDIPG